MFRSREPECLGKVLGVLRLDLWENGRKEGGVEWAGGPLTSYRTTSDPARFGVLEVHTYSICKASV